MKNLFLTSSFKDVVPLFTEFESNLQGKTVSFIPTASTVEEVVFYVEAGKKALKDLGLIVEELDVATETLGEITATLKKNDFIYVTGGNTFFLLQELKRTGADKLLLEEIAKGKLYIGESAGAVITSPNISYIQSMDSVKKATNLTNYDALNLVNFYTLPHYNNAPFKKITQQIIADYTDDLKIFPISNCEAIVVQDNVVTSKGIL
ncbi:type 1 glutamine amidotransferase-like domain-containing protein [Listeria sp. FSL L7-1699]|uniref:Type 1 glutamine amidotransferase-like domain-containing protein n=1 Tax=Listeria farberi TaxID=2713500 RepID=A0ABR6SQ05_9LIST|nr:Type 1 glutamine amidotransferase-like domain-containing protein [Listeria farberi]MBC1376275.1 type 1 glutamine amidotransferase-like domain-containing protein [Listeria farberi]MBC1380108.1 type 1 glutamine amidotransferase-like domain-containing protein [Listeria farberi]MBC2266344.1 type 1 glutamine amidotransferase-like domain-containing protein [Listeria farberi]